MNRQHSFVDRCIGAADDLLKIFAGGAGVGQRPSPADTEQPDQLSTAEKKHIAGLMRVNHCGEVCAQALYKGQSLTAKSEDVRTAMLAASAEEEDHLAWCEQRLQELGSRTSYLNPLWYGLSFSMGALAGVAGDKISLGFVAATEEQVCEHLNRHFDEVPETDAKTRAVLAAMITDEARHAETALAQGGRDFPGQVKQLMTLVSTAMTRSSYHL